MKLSRVTEPDFFLSEITELRWLELPITQTHFDSPFEFEQAKFYCIYYLLCIIDWFKEDAVGEIIKETDRISL
jgi:hypothetical protein